MSLGEVRGTSGRRYRLDGILTQGGQGVIHKAAEVRTGKPGAVKLFHAEWRRRDVHERTRYLVAAGPALRGECPVLCPPEDVIDRPRGCLGHFTPWVEGETWEEVRMSMDFSFLQGLRACAAMAEALAVLERRGMAHGDLQSGNLKLKKESGALQVSILDFDNFAACGAPPPSHLGQLYYLAPELRDAPLGSRSGVPNAYSDRFALGVVMHEILLLLHPANGFDQTEEGFRAAMCSGRWLHDPAGGGSRPDGLGGYPPQVLNSDLARLFRRSMSLDPGDRPSAASWRDALLRAIDSVHVCACQGPELVDVGKTACPFCHARYPVPVLDSGRGLRIRLQAASTVVGRDHLGGAPAVSERHALFVRRGPTITVVPRGRNGTFRWDGVRWVRLLDGAPVRVGAGDRLRFADVEARMSNEDASRGG